MQNRDSPSTRSIPARSNLTRARAIFQMTFANEAALKDLIRAAVALNLKGKSQTKPKPKRSRGSSSVGLQ
jgi:hypothetical protein